MNPVDLAGGFSDLEMTCSFTALAPPLHIERILRIIQLKTIVRTFAIICNYN